MTVSPVAVARPGGPVEPAATAGLAFMAGRFLAVVRERDGLAAQVAAVRALHVSRVDAGFQESECARCRSPWPCPTVAAMDAAS